MVRYRDVDNFTVLITKNVCIKCIGMLCVTHTVLNCGNKILLGFLNYSDAVIVSRFAGGAIYCASIVDGCIRLQLCIGDI